MYTRLTQKCVIFGIGFENFVLSLYDRGYNVFIRFMEDLVSVGMEVPLNANR